MNMQKTAIVFGATGLTGKYLVNELVKNNHYQKIKVVNRKPQNYDHPKIEEHLIDFNQIDEYAHEFKADDVFCCLGTTLKKAGSKEKFFEIDHDLPIQIANICHNNHCETFIGISSVGANQNSRNYYLRTKGIMEQDILNIDFRYQAIVRPSMLLGKRDEARLAEAFGKFIMKIFSFLFVGKLKKYQGIHAQTVAKAMLYIAIHQDHFSTIEKNIFESDELINSIKKDIHDKQ